MPFGNAVCLSLAGLIMTTALRNASGVPGRHLKFVLSIFTIVTDCRKPIYRPPVSESLKEYDTVYSSLVSYMPLPKAGDFYNGVYAEILHLLSNPTEISLQGSSKTFKLSR